MGYRCRLSRQLYLPLALPSTVKREANFAATQRGFYSDNSTFATMVPLMRRPRIEQRT